MPTPIDHDQQDAAIQTDLAILRTKVRQAMHGRSDASVFSLDLVDLALEMCEGLMRNEVTATVPLLMEQLDELLGTELGPDGDEPEQIMRVSAA